MKKMSVEMNSHLKFTKLNQPVQSKDVKLANKISWSKILQHRSQFKTRTVFDSCDPLRSLHFLMEELCTKINSKPTLISSELIRILCTIRELMLRVPQSTKSFNNDTKKGMSSNHAPVLVKGKSENKLVQTVPHKKPKVEEKQVQTFQPKVREKIKVNKSSQINVDTNVFSTQIDLIEKQVEDKLKAYQMQVSNLEAENRHLLTQLEQVKKLLAQEEAITVSLHEEINTNEHIYQEEKSKFMEELCTIAKENEELKYYAQRGHQLEIENKVLEEELEKAQREAITAQLNYEKVCVVVNQREKQLEILQKEFSNIQDQISISEKSKPTSSSSLNVHHRLTPSSWGLLSEIQSERKNEEKDMDQVKESSQCRGAGDTSANIFINIPTDDDDSLQQSEQIVDLNADVDLIQLENTSGKIQQERLTTPMTQSTPQIRYFNANNKDELLKARRKIIKLIESDERKITQQDSSRFSDSNSNQLDKNKYYTDIIKNMRKFIKLKSQIDNENKVNLKLDT